LFLKGDTFSRRDYVFIYTGNVMAATVKGRYKRVWVGEKPGLSGAAFFDLYTDPREENALLNRKKRAGLLPVLLFRK
jgi:arylsulfatase